MGPLLTCQTRLNASFLMKLNIIEDNKRGDSPITNDWGMSELVDIISLPFSYLLSADRMLPQNVYFSTFQ